MDEKIDVVVGVVEGFFGDASTLVRGQVGGKNPHFLIHDLAFCVGERQDRAVLFDAQADVHRRSLPH